MIETRKGSLVCRYMVHHYDYVLEVISIRKKGWPDRLFVLTYGRNVYVEFKQGGRYGLTQEQKIVKNLLTDAGHRYILFSFKDETIKSASERLSKEII